MASVFLTITNLIDKIIPKINKMINYAASLKRSMMGHMSQVNEVTVLEAYKKGVRDAIRKVGYHDNTTRVNEIIDAFVVTKNIKETGGGNKAFEFKFDNPLAHSRETFKYNFNGREYLTFKSKVIDLLDKGRQGGEHIGRGTLFGGPTSGINNHPQYTGYLAWKRGGKFTQIVWNPKNQGPIILGRMQPANIFTGGHEAVQALFEKIRTKIRNKEKM